MKDLLIGINQSLSDLLNLMRIGMGLGAGFTLGAFIVCALLKWRPTWTVHLHNHFGGEKDQ